MAAVGAESSLAGEAEPGPDGGGVAAPAALLQGDVEPGQATVAQQPQHKHVKLPLSRVKALIKADPDVTLASQESVFVITKATELFIETIAKDAFIYAQQGKRKTLQRKDLDQAIFAMDEFAFLEGALD